MLFMVIERFRNHDPVPVYQRLRAKGRMMPEGLRYIDSWIEPNFDRVFQLMECDNPTLFQQWLIEWGDLMDMEFVPVVPSRDTVAALAPYLDQLETGDAP